jgi:hypothetical protein
MRDVQSVVAELFQRWPSLVGFSVQDVASLSDERVAGHLEDELCLVDMETQPYATPPEELFGDVAVALIDLMDEDPATREALRGRTFARALH